MSATSCPLPSPFFVLEVVCVEVDLAIEVVVLDKMDHVEQQ